MHGEKVFAYDKRDGVDVVDDVVGDSVELHDGGLGSQVTGHLVVSEPVDGVEQEAVGVIKVSQHSLAITSSFHLHLAGRDGTLDLVNPLVVVDHPRSRASSLLRGLSIVP